MAIPEPRTPTYAELAMQMMSSKDPIESFIESIGNEEVRAFARETIAMRDTFVTYATSMLTSTEVVAAVHDAEWVRDHAAEVAYRWATLRRAATAWAHLIQKPIVINQVG